MAEKFPIGKIEFGPDRKAGFDDLLRTVKHGKAIVAITPEKHLDAIAAAEQRGAERVMRELEIAQKRLAFIAKYVAPEKNPSEGFATGDIDEYEGWETCASAVRAILALSPEKLPDASPA